VPFCTFKVAHERGHPALEAEDLGVGRDISRGRGQPEFREQITGRQFCVESQRDLETFGRRCLGVERVKGIEPSCAAWEAAVLPLNYTRARLRF
jgi:hypothetical protein